MRGTRREYDRAYACFLVCGLAALLGCLMEALPKNEGTAAQLGFFVAIPLALASLAALVVGIGLSARRPIHGPLVILSVMSVLFVATLFFGSGSAAFYNAIALAYGVSAVAISGAWFAVLRRS